MSRIGSKPLGLAIVGGLFLAASPLAAEQELSFYLGFQESPHSKVSGTDPENPTPTLDFTAGWEGRSFEMPPYYGLRWTNWRNERFGWGVEFTHSKVYADDATLAANGYDRLELTDGLNIVTLNGFRRWPDQWGEFTPYVGAGLGFAVPHVDITTTGSADPTFGYQVTGPAVRWTAGASYQLNDTWSLFGEYQGTYSAHDIQMDNGGNMQTDIITNAVNLGVSFSF